MVQHKMVCSLNKVGAGAMVHKPADIRICLVHAQFRVGG